jgi:hypothetical protein
VSDVSTIETDLRFSAREDFWIIAAAVGEHLARLVRQSIRAGLAVVDIGRSDRDFLDQSRGGVGAHMSLESMDCRTIWRAGSAAENIFIIPWTPLSPHRRRREII